MFTTDFTDFNFDLDGGFIFRGRSASKLEGLNLDLNSLVYFTRDFDDCHFLYNPSDEDYFSARSKAFHSFLSDLSSSEFRVFSYLYTCILQVFSSPELSVRYYFSKLLEQGSFSVPFCPSKFTRTSFCKAFLFAYYGAILHYYNPDFKIEIWTLPFEDLPF